MKLAESVVAWTPATANSPTAGIVRVGPIVEPGQQDWTTSFACTGGGAYIGVRKLSEIEAVAWIFIEFHLLVARDRIPVDKVHEAFLGIDDFGRNIPQTSRPQKKPKLCVG